MWFYTADTVTRLNAVRRPGVVPQHDRPSPLAHRLAVALRSLADRVDTRPLGAPATDW